MGGCAAKLKEMNKELLTPSRIMLESNNIFKEHAQSEKLISSKVKEALKETVKGLAPFIPDTAHEAAMKHAEEDDSGSGDLSAEEFYNLVLTVLGKADVKWYGDGVGFVP